MWRRSPAETPRTAFTHRRPRESATYLSARTSGAGINNLILKTLRGDGGAFTACWRPRRLFLAARPSRS